MDMVISVRGEKSLRTGLPFLSSEGKFFWSFRRDERLQSPAFDQGILMSEHQREGLCKYLQIYQTMLMAH